MFPANARLTPLDATAPIRSLAAEEGNVQIPLWSVPLVLVVLYVCLFSGLGAIGLVGPDEPRYAAIARAMAETHDWVTPRLWGTPWFEKPVLYYWAAGAAMRLFCVSEFSARLPSALAALLAVLAATWTALRSYGLGAAWYTLLMLPTSVAMIGFARAAGPDMLFAGFLTAAMAVAVEMLQKSRPGNLSRVLFGFFLGAAVLAKGPAAIVLAGGATLLWAAFSRQWRAAFQFLHPVLIATFLVTSLPWYILCALRNPNFLRVFLWQHNFERYLTPVFEHRQPFWFFAPILLLSIFPWLPLAVITLSDINRKLRNISSAVSPGWFYASWSLFTLLFFSASQSKLPGYILPAIPPALLLLVRSTARQTDQETNALRLAVACVGILVPVSLGVARAKFPFKFVEGMIPDSSPARATQIAFGIALIGGTLIALFALRRKLEGAICLAACTVAILTLTADRLILPQLDGFVSARPAATGIVKLYAARTSEIAVFQLPRGYEYGLNYYFQKELPQWPPEHPRDAFVFTSEEGMVQLDQLDLLRDGRGGTRSPATWDGKIWFFPFRLNPHIER